MWKTIHDSVVGSSHQKAALPCQDNSLVSSLKLDDDEVLIAVCADGAGSASHAEHGAKLACESFARAVAAGAQNLQTLRQLDVSAATAWVAQVHAELHEEAVRRDVQRSDLACTLLAAVVGREAAVFVQIGDGVIVRFSEGAYQPVFWPQSGEYINTTNFVTQDDFLEKVSVEKRDERIDELAVLSDGLQPLALAYATKTAHAPFFAPLFRALRDIDQQADLQAPLRAFMESPAVCERTDDDKTLILATRLPKAEGLQATALPVSP